MSAAPSLEPAEAWDTPTLHRREAGTPSARSLLLTILGEFVLPQGGPVWTATLVEALAAVGVEEKAARQALARTSAEGLIEPARVGRRTRWALTRAGGDLLDEGARRIYGFMREQRRWDGRWLILSVTVPETQRQLRHRLRSRLTWAGMGSAAPGLWVLPHADRAPARGRGVPPLPRALAPPRPGALGHPLPPALTLPLTPAPAVSPALDGVPVAT
jgi:phenylacetic acid degradation operon negative regulatory protein